MRYSTPRYIPSPAPRRMPIRPARRFAWNSPWLLFGAAALLISLALLPFLSLGGMVFYYSLAERVYPGVMVGPLSAGDLTRAELAQQIDAIWNTAPRLVLTDGQHSWPAQLADAGLWVDPQATAEKAYQVGRESGGLAQLLWLVRFQQIQVTPGTIFNPDVARAGLERLAGQVNRPAVEATIALQNGQWVAVPGQNGSQMDVEGTLARLSANPQAVMDNATLPVAIQVVAPRLADASPVLSQLNAALNLPVKLQAYDPITDQTSEWSIPREVFGSWVTVSYQDGQLSVGLDGQQLASYVQTMLAGLDDGRVLEPFTPPADLASLWQSGQPLSLTIHHNPTAYTVGPGETLTRIAFKVGMPYWMIQQANPGIDADRLQAGQVLTIPSKNDLLPLPVIPGKRIVISISEQHMWVYENGSLRNEYVISTGIDRSPTIPGVYQVQTHELSAYASVWNLTMPHFMGIYQGWPGFMNGIHGLPTLSSGKLLWAGNLGHQVSYGCIILGLQEAEDLYNWAEEGTIVEIKP